METLFISVYDQITVSAVLAAFPDTIHITESTSVAVDGDGETVILSVFDEVLLDGSASVFSSLHVVAWDNIVIEASVGSFPDMVHIEESFIVFVEDAGVSVGGSVETQITLEDQIVNIITVVDVYGYELITVDETLEVLVENLTIEVLDYIWFYDAGAEASGVSLFVDVYSEVEIVDLVELLIPLLPVDVGDDIGIFPIAGAKSALAIQCVDIIGVSDDATVTLVCDLFVFDVITVIGDSTSINFDLITYFVYESIDINERGFFYTRDFAFANLTPPEYRGRGTHGISHGKRFGGTMEVIIAGSIVKSI